MSMRHFQHHTLAQARSTSICERHTTLERVEHRAAIGDEPGPASRMGFLALALWPHDDPELRAMLAAEGITVSFVPTYQTLLIAYEALTPELLLIDPELFDEDAPLPHEAAQPIIVLPASFRGAPGEALPEWMERSLAHAIRQARAVQRRLRQRAAQDAAAWSRQRISAMGEHIAAAPTPRKGILQLMTLVRDLFCVEAGTLYRYDESKERLVFEFVFGSKQALLEQMVMPTGRGVAGAVVQTGEPLLIADTGRDKRFAHEFDHSTGLTTRSLLCVPLEADGRRWGALQLINKLDGEFSEDDLLTLRMVSHLPAVVEALSAYEVEQAVGLRSRESFA